MANTNSNGENFPPTPPSSPLPPATPPSNNLHTSSADATNTTTTNTNNTTTTNTNTNNTTTNNTTEDVLRDTRKSRAALSFADEVICDESNAIGGVAVDDAAAVVRKRQSRGSIFHAIASTILGGIDEHPPAPPHMAEASAAAAVDPSIQPVPYYSIPPQVGFPGALPGYPLESYQNFPQNIRDFDGGDLVVEKIRNDPTAFSAPEPQVDALTEMIRLPVYEQSQEFQPVEVGYDWSAVPQARMTRVPYPGASFSPLDPSPQYMPANPFVAYPYGVPAVEENETIYTWALATKKVKHYLGCC
eukprot:GHVS01019941.1.p1 GENE.GHVS01019941.1~~GHVS01019941.1.p1  ORF type:complete len:302 (+),score=80.57 GHVS01019941.1:119-1024(+)